MDGDLLDMVLSSFLLSEPQRAVVVLSLRKPAQPYLK